ncbi:MAG: peptide deformylase [Pelagibacterales bacterium]|nr:peptide deformylase [Pelagibacterales bacterium]OUV26934.1 MAG: peptide deformylase [Alphaproteobacteria bacterium TMED109]RCL83912.1 MAG: peptide deformylase [Alphaproteobacteria bacterium]|tara:strand:- start:685 stop:1206 length:522 start_codon:yes stop_codon:yes gene_type:complete
MSILNLVYAPATVLEKKAHEVKNIDKSLKSFVNNMFDTMYKNNGVGLAAPQVNESLQVIVMDCSSKNKESNPRVLLNPKIINQSDTCKEYEEGCLSFPDHYFSISRPDSLNVKFLDLEGNKKETFFSGFEAVCVQHEIDHLSGTLFTSYISRLKRQIILKKMQKFKKNINKSI